MREFLRNPNKLPLAPCSNLFRIILTQASLDSSACKSLAERGGFLRNPHSLPMAPPLREGFLRNPHSLPMASLQSFYSQPHLSKLRFGCS